MTISKSRFSAIAAHLRKALRFTGVETYGDWYSDCTRATAIFERLSTQSLALEPKCLRVEFTASCNEAEGHTPIWFQRGMCTGNCGWTATGTSNTTKQSHHNTSKHIERRKRAGIQLSPNDLYGRRQAHPQRDTPDKTQEMQLFGGMSTAARACA